MAGPPLAGKAWRGVEPTAVSLSSTEGGGRQREYPKDPYAVYEDDVGRQGGHSPQGSDFDSSSVAPSLVMGQGQVTFKFHLDIPGLAAPHSASTHVETCWKQNSHTDHSFRASRT